MSAISADQQAGKHIAFPFVGTALADLAALLLDLLKDRPPNDRFVDVLKDNPVLPVIFNSLFVLVRLGVGFEILSVFSSASSTRQRIKKPTATALLALQAVFDALSTRGWPLCVLHADETTLQVLKEPGKSAQSKSYMWLYRTGIDAKHPSVLYEYNPNRKAENAEKFLEGFSGWLHADGYDGYHKLNENIRVVGCFAHAQRPASRGKSIENGLKRLHAARCRKNLAPRSSSPSLSTPLHLTGLRNPNTDKARLKRASPYLG